MKEPVKKMWSKSAHLGKGEVPGQEGMGSRSQRKALISSRRTERCQLHCSKVNGGGKESRHKPFVSLAAAS